MREEFQKLKRFIDASWPTLGPVLPTSEDQDVANVGMSALRISKLATSPDNIDPAPLWSLSQNIERAAIEIADGRDELRASVFAWVEQMGVLAKAVAVAIERGVPDAHRKSNQDVRNTVWAMTDGKCAYCWCTLVDEGCSSNSFVVEHVVPASAGGPDHISNYVPACAACNSAKRDNHVLTFIQRAIQIRQGQRPEFKVVNGGSVPYSPERFGDDNISLSRKDLAAGETE